MPWDPVHPEQNGNKKCISCKLDLPVDRFPKQSQSRNGVRPDCKECSNKKNKIYYEKNRNKILNKAREYGKTEQRKKYCRDFAKEKLKQKREREADRPRSITCECCGELPTKIGVVWDHCHDTGKFRGWLCNRCNRVLGMCKDSEKVFKKMIEYLRIHGKVQ